MCILVRPEAGAAVTFVGFLRGPRAAALVLVAVAVLRAPLCRLPLASTGRGHSAEVANRTAAADVSVWQLL